MKSKNYVKEQRELAQAKVDVVEGGLIGMIIGLLLLVGGIIVGCVL